MQRLVDQVTGSIAHGRNISASGNHGITRLRQLDIINFTEAYENYMDMDLSRYLTSIEAMAREEWLYNTAETLFGGQFMEPFVRYSTTSSALHQAVQKELRKIVDQDSRCNKLTASWESAKQKISAAFDMAKRKGTLVIDTTDQEPPTAGGPA